MKKMLAMAALCAGVFVFSNANFAEAEDQQTGKVASIVQNSGYDVQQLSTKDKKEELAQSTEFDVQQLSTKDKKEELAQSTEFDVQQLSTKDKKEEL